MYQEKTVESFVTHTTTKPEELGGQTQEGKVPTAPGDRTAGCGWEERRMATAATSQPGSSPSFLYRHFRGVKMLKTFQSNSHLLDSSVFPTVLPHRVLFSGSWLGGTGAGGVGTRSTAWVFWPSSGRRGQRTSWGCCTGYLRGDPRGLISADQIEWRMVIVTVSYSTMFRSLRNR